MTNSSFDWITVKFGDICKNVSIRMENPQNSKYEKFIGLEHLDSEDPKIHRYGFSKDVISSVHIFKKGHILFGRRNWYLRRIAVTDFDGVCSGDIYVFEHKEGLILKEFLPIFMLSNEFFEKTMRYSEGSMSKRVKWKNLEEIEFSIPSIPLQKLIIETLTQVDDVLNNLNELIQTTYDLQKSVLNQYITNGINHFKFKKKQFVFKFIEENIPDDWDYMPLSKTSVDGFKNGIFKKPEEFGKDGCPIVNVTDLFSESQLDISNLERVKVDPNELQNFGISKGDIFFCRSSLVRSGVGRSNIISDLPEPSVFECHVIRLRPSNVIIPEFLYYFTRSRIFQKFLLAIGMTLTMTTIRQEDLGSIPVPIPPIEEQQKIVFRIKEIDERIIILKNHKKKTHQLRKTLLHFMLRSDKNKKRMKSIVQ